MERNREYRELVRTETEKLENENIFESAFFRQMMLSVAGEITGGTLKKVELVKEPEGRCAGTCSRDKVVLNLQNFMTVSFPTVPLMSDSLVGILGHECGHWNFSDFEIRKEYLQGLQNGKWYQSHPKPETEEEKEHLKEINQYLEKKHPVACSLLCETASFIQNIGIQYLMEDQQSELYNRLLDFPVRSIEEMVFIISILPDDQSVWESVKGKLNQLLGKERTCSAYTHTGIYAWLTTRYHIQISGYRKKDIETLKYLMRLPFSYAKEGSIARKKLLEAGYSVQEIMYLSMSLLYQVSACDLLKKTGLTVEWMAVETCMLFLNGKGEFLDQAGELCARLLKDYWRFDVRLDGMNRIRDYLYQSLKVENVKTYQILLLDDKWDSMHSNWFLIDLTDAKWQELYSLIERDSFDKWVFETLKVKPYTKNQIERYLQVYQDLTNEDFYQHFWKIEDSDLKVIFRKLADLGLVHPLGLLKSYLEEYQSNADEAGKKWIMMIQYLEAYMDGLETMEAVEMVFQIEKLFGISSRGPFPIEKLFLDSIGIDNGYRGLYFESMDLIRPFLDIKGHQQMFCIVEQYMLKMHPEKYISFLINVLSSEDNFIWFPKEEARKVFLKLAEISKNQSELDRLRRIYLTEEDFEAVKAKRKEREQRHLLVKQRKKIRDIRKDFSLYVAKARKTQCQFEKLWKYVQKYKYD